MKRLALVVAAAIALGAVATYRVDAKKTVPEPVIVINRTASASYVESPSGKLFFALVIGSDVRAGDPAAGRSDSLHIVAGAIALVALTAAGVRRVRRERELRHQRALTDHLRFRIERPGRPT